MDFKALTTFRRIVELGGFNRAAESLNYAQSTVTMQIQKLEAELGVSLFNRTRGMQLTEAGRMLHERSERLIRDAAQLRNQLSALHNGEAGHVRLGVTEPTASHRLPSLLAKFLTQYPAIRITVEILSTPRLCERLMQGSLDLAIGSASTLVPDLHYEPLFQESFLLLLPDDHPLAREKSVSPSDLQDLRLLITAPDCPYRERLEHILLQKGVPSVDTMEIGSMTALRYYVAAGLGVAFVPAILLNPAPDGTTARPLESADIHMESGLMIRASEYPPTGAASKLYEALQIELIQADQQKNEIARQSIQDLRTTSI